MAKVVLKTAKRKTSVTRLAVRKAVKGLFGNQDKDGVKSDKKDALHKPEKH